MDAWWQWLLGLVIPAVLGFYLGGKRERRKNEIAVRREILKPVEDWLQDIMRLVSIIGDELSALTQGLPPLRYTIKDRTEISEPHP